jgi:hypothetical protein
MEKRKAGRRLPEHLPAFYEFNHPAKGELRLRASYTNPTKNKEGCFGSPLASSSSDNAVKR